MAANGPIPGNTPTNVPRKQPTKQKNKLVGVATVANPKEKLFSRSVKVVASF